MGLLRLPAQCADRTLEIAEKGVALSPVTSAPHEVTGFGEDYISRHDASYFGGLEGLLTACASTVSTATRTFSTLGTSMVMADLLIHDALRRAVSSMVESARGSSSICWITTELSAPSKPMMLSLLNETP